MALLLTCGLLALSERSESKGCSPVLLLMPLGNATAFMFENLQVYQKAVAFADAVCTLTRGFPRGYSFLADQLNRAALPIAANIAEGNGRFTKADRRNFFGIARGSVQECVPLLELASRQTLVEAARGARLRSGLGGIARMLSGLIKGFERREMRAAARVARPTRPQVRPVRGSAARPESPVGGAEQERAENAQAERRAAP